jgi:hypothetical protein
MWKVWLPVVLMLSGCAASVESSSDRTVVIKAPADRIAEAQKLADAECAKRGRYARLAGKTAPFIFVYDCTN